MTIFIEENETGIEELLKTMEKAAKRAVELEGLPEEAPLAPGEDCGNEAEQSGRTGGMAD
jgi:hypothetical protein